MKIGIYGLLYQLETTATGKNDGQNFALFNKESDMCKKYLLDTTVFNKFVKNSKLDRFPESQNVLLYATPLQEAEIKNTPNCDLRDSLLKLFSTVGVQNPIFCFGVAGAGWEQGEWGNDTSRDEIKVIQEKIRKCDRKRGKTHRKEEEFEICLNDALILETAIRKKLFLVTDDICLSTIAKEKNVEVISSETLDNLWKIKN